MDTLYAAFLEELNALEKFRMAYSGKHSSEVLGRDDPDVKRLIEAMAFFNARTRTSVMENVLKSRNRIFEQFFSPLLTPLPAMGILQAYSSGRFTEKFTLPKNSEIVVIPTQGEEEAYFRTLCDLHLFPISLKKAELVYNGQQGFRIYLYFNTSYPRNDLLEKLSLYISYLNNYNSSLKFLYALQKHFQKCSVFFEEKILENTKGFPCEVSFGKQEDMNALQNTDLSHPFQRIRSFFHYPQQELYVNFTLPTPPRNWVRFTLAIDVDAEWPKSFNIHRDIFQLFTVPMINLKQSMAQPFLCDGSKELYPIRYPEPNKQFSVQSVLGVYSIEKQGLVPLRPGVLSGGNGSYEIENISHSDTANVIIHLPEAFFLPQKIAIDALWYQPSLSPKLAHISRVFPSTKNIEGISWDILGEIRLHQENTLKRSGDTLLQFLSLQKKPIFDLQEILFLIQSLGCLEKTYFQSIPALVQDVLVKAIPQSKKTVGIQYIYEFHCKEFDVSYRPLVESFFYYVLVLLQACSIDNSISLKVQITSQEPFELK